jgi:hypothetical protein
MNDSEEGRFGELPKWPDEAKDLPQEADRERSYRSEWGIGVGSAIAIVTFLLFYGAPLAFMVLLLVGGFSVGFYIGLGIDKSISNYDRKWDR